MAVSRFGILKNKRLNSNHAYREEIAKLLRQGNEELARIKVESVINNDNYIAAVDILCMICQICSERLRVIIESKDPPSDIRYAVETLIWSASRSDCDEMLKVREQFVALYGEVFCRNAVSNANGLVNSIVSFRQVISKLEATLPEDELKIVKLKEIAAEKMIEYIPAGEAWKGMIPQFKPSDLYSSHSSVPSAPHMSMSPYDNDRKGSPKGGVGGSPDSEGFYPKLSSIEPKHNYNTPPPQGYGLNTGSSVSTQTAEQANASYPLKQPEGPTDPRGGPSPAVPHSDYDQLMDRFSKLRK